MHGYATIHGLTPSIRVVNSVDPNTGSTAGGELVTVNGRNFVATPSVQFGTVYSSGVSFVSDRVLSVTTPAHGAGTVDLRVINPDLQSDILTNGFTFISSGPPPVITSVDPDNGDITGGETVTVSGEDFVDGATVFFGGVQSATVIFVSSTSLNVVTPAHSEGLVDVTVTNPDLQSDTLVIGFTYVDLSALPDVRLHFFHNDHLGTPLYLTDTTGTVVWEGQYWPFGDIYTQNTDPDGDGKNVYQPFRFPGQYEDAETGLYYNYFRDYDPMLGRYVEADPIGLAGGVNLWGYADFSSINAIDPLGLVWYKGEMTFIGGGLAVGGGWGFYEICEAECKENKRMCALYSFRAGGLMFGLKLGKGFKVSGDFSPGGSTSTFYYDDGRPGWAAPDFDGFSGWMTMGTLTGAFGKMGATFGGFSVGDHDDISLTGEAKGLAAELSGLFGKSHMVGSPWTEKCCDDKNR